MCCRFATGAYQPWFFPLSLLASLAVGVGLGAVHRDARCGKLVDVGGRGASARRRSCAARMGVVASPVLDAKFGEVRVHDPRGNELIVHGHAAPKAMRRCGRVTGWCSIELEDESGLFGGRLRGVRRTMMRGIEVWQLAAGLVGAVALGFIVFMSAMARFLKRPSPSEAIIRIGRATTDVFIGARLLDRAGAAPGGDHVAVDDRPHHPARRARGAGDQGLHLDQPVGRVLHPRRAERGRRQEGGAHHRHRRGARRRPTPSATRRSSCSSPS